MQEIIIPIDADGLIVKATETGTDHFIDIDSQQKRNQVRPILLIEIRCKGSSQYKTIERFKIGIDDNFKFTAPIEEYRFTVIDGDNCGINQVVLKDYSTAGENSNANLDTDVVDRMLSGDDYVGSNFASLADLNAARSSSQPMTWALVADNGSGSPGIAVSNGTSFALMDSSTNDGDQLRAGFAGGSLYIKNLMVG